MTWSTFGAPGNTGHFYTDARLALARDWQWKPCPEMITMAFSLGVELEPVRLGLVFWAEPVASASGAYFLGEVVLAFFEPLAGWTRPADLVTALLSSGHAASLPELGTNPERCGADWPASRRFAWSVAEGLFPGCRVLRAEAPKPTFFGSTGSARAGTIFEALIAVARIVLARCAQSTSRWPPTEVAFASEVFCSTADSREGGHHGQVGADPQRRIPACVQAGVQNAFRRGPELQMFRNKSRWQRPCPEGISARQAQRLSKP